MKVQQFHVPFQVQVPGEPMPKSAFVVGKHGCTEIEINGNQAIVSRDGGRDAIVFVGQGYGIGIVEEKKRGPGRPRKEPKGDPSAE